MIKGQQDGTKDLNDLYAWYRSVILDRILNFQHPFSRRSAPALKRPRALRLGRQTSVKGRRGKVSAPGPETLRHGVLRAAISRLRVRSGEKEQTAVVSEKDEDQEGTGCSESHKKGER